MIKEIKATVKRVLRIKEPTVDEIIKQVVKDTQGKIENITHGGCGVFAYDVATQLQAKGIPFEIVALGWGKDEAKPLVKALNDLENGVKEEDDIVQSVPEHFMIKVNGKWLDGRYYGEDLPDEDFVELRKYTIDELKLTVAEGRWNDEYDRGQNSKLEEIVEKDFSKLTNVNTKKHTVSTK